MYYVVSHTYTDIRNSAEMENYCVLRYTHAYITLQKLRLGALETIPSEVAKMVLKIVTETLKNTSYIA